MTESIFKAKLRPKCGAASTWLSQQHYHQYFNVSSVRPCVCHGCDVVLSVRVCVCHGCDVVLSVRVCVCHGCDVVLSVCVCVCVCVTDVT